MKKIQILSHKILLATLIFAQQSMVAGPVISSLITDSLHMIDLYIAYHIEQKPDFFHIAVQTNNKQALIYGLVQSNSNKLVNAQDEQGNTPLHYAAEGNSISTVDLLLFNGASPAILNKDNKYPCDIAAQRLESDKIIKRLSPRSKFKKHR